VAGGAAAGGAAGGVLAKIAGSGVGKLVAGGVTSGAVAAGSAAEGAGFAGLAEAIAGAGAAVAPIAAGLLPLLAAAGGVYGLVQLFGLFSGHGGTTTTYSGSQLATLLQQQGTGALSHPGGVTGPATARGGPGGSATEGTATIGQLGATQAAKQALDAWAKSVSNSTALSKLSIPQLQGMVREGQALAQIFPQDAQLIDKFTNRLKADLTPLQGVWDTINTRWGSAVGSGLKNLTDIFDTNTRLIAHDIGLNSDNGRQAMAHNVALMVSDVTKGMDDGKISVTNGMAAIKQALQQGMADNAINWNTSWHDMFTTLTNLYDKHKIDTTTYYAELQQITSASDNRVAHGTEVANQNMFAYLKQQQADGNLTHAEFLSKWHDAQAAANATESVDMASFASSIQSAMKAAGALTAQGMALITKETNNALGLFGAAKLPIPQAIAWNNYNLSGGTANTGGAGHQGLAVGGLVTRPMYLAGEEAPNHPEYVLATNPAYRQRNLKLWSAAGRELGVPGFAQGGVYSYGQLEGAWDQAGGPRGDAALAAAIAMAESGGRSVMQTGQPWATTGWGPWQITPGNASLLPLTPNALAAVAKFRGARDSFRPWTTFEDGAYRAFLHGNVPASALGGLGALAQIVAPRVSGSGPMSDIVSGALKKVTAAVNTYLVKHAPTGGGVGGGGVFLPGGHLAGGGRGAYSALRVERTDQGLDFGGAGPVGAVLAGHVLSTGLWGGWPGSGGIVYSTADGNVYVMEDFAASVGRGQRLTAGQVIGRALGGSDGIETGWANASGTGPLTPYNGAPDGTATAGGQSFRRFAGYRQGGLPFAGAFAGGGMVTANGPTMALFGENGAETAMFMPHYKTGGVVGGALAGSTGPTAALVISLGGVVGGALAGSTGPTAALVISFEHLAAEMAASLAGILKTIHGQTVAGTNATTLTGLLTALTPGTSLKSLGLNATSLKALGISHATATALIGGGQGSFAAQGAIAGTALAGYQKDQKNLEALYKKALKDHNKTLAKTLLGELSTVDQDILTSAGTVQSLWGQAVAAAIGAITDGFTNLIQGFSDTSTTLTAIQGLPAGTNLSALGLSPGVLQSLGLNPSAAQGQVGNGLASWQTLASSQGGLLSPSQLASATSGVNAINAGLTSQETPIVGALNYDQGLLPSTTGDARATLVNTMQGLAQTLIGLQTTIGSNNTALKALTTATNANTSATTSSTGAMTGSTSYSYNGNYYPASLSSDSVTNSGVGL